MSATPGPVTGPVAGPVAGALPARIRRHVAETMTLAWPVIVARSGILVMALVDTVMVGRLSTDELAYLGIGQAPFMPVMLTGLGLLIGTVAATAMALGAGRAEDCGAAWRRAVPYALWLGVGGAALCTLGEPFLRLTGQTSELAHEGAEVLFVLGLGIPGHLVFVATSFFLEGLKRPKPAMAAMIVANVLNVLLNWVFIYGNLGFPALGAVGSAWATSGVRLFLAIALVSYVWWMPARDLYGVRRRPRGGWSAWRRQRRIGYGAAFSIGFEVSAFSTLNLFAGWLGTEALAAYAIVINLIGLAFMVALGFGSATSVRVGSAHGQGRESEAALAGWVGLGLNSLTMMTIGILFLALPGTLIGAYSADPGLIARAVPLVALAALILTFDGGQTVMAQALRGRGETWAPAVIQGIAFLGLMIPGGWYLAFAAGRGIPGLFEGIVLASILSVALLCLRFHMLTRHGDRADPAASTR